jgi:TatD DNase family protein
MTLIDTHCHLAHGKLRPIVGDVLRRAADAGVAAVVCAAGDLAESKAAAALAHEHASVWFTAGIHPHEAKDVPAGYLGVLQHLLENPRNVAMGEIGLDYHYDFSPRPLQRRVFLEQLELARRQGSKVVVHTREAFEDTMALLRDSGIDATRVAFHSCTEGPEHVEQMVAMGAMIGLGGIVTFKKADDLRLSAVAVPADRLLVETDSPYLSPEPVRAMRVNEPANVVHVARFLAELRQTPPEELARQTTRNAASFFDAPWASPP